MGKIIEFYVPNSFRKKTLWISPQQRGKLIEFCVPAKNLSCGLGSGCFERVSELRFRRKCNSTTFFHSVSGLCRYGVSSVVLA